MDFHTLKVFTVVADLQSFSMAGEKLFLTQPAISKRIAALECEFDSQLFDRVGRQVRLTEAGRTLLPKARKLLDEMADIRRSIGNLSGQVNGTLSMGTSHHIGLHRMPDVLRAYRKNYKDVQLDIRFQDSESACKSVAKGSLELGIVTLPPEPLPQVRMQHLWDDPLLFAVSRDHALARETAPTLESLVAHPAVLPSPNTYTRDILERILREKDLELNVGMTTNYLETLKMLATTGLGWALLPATMLSDQLVAVDIPGIALRRRLGIVIHDKHTLSNAARAMLDTCLEHADGACGTPG